MYLPILIAAILVVTAAPPVIAKDLPPAAQTEESGSRASLEIFDQQNTIKVTCETFQIQAWAPSEDDKSDSTNVDCGGTAIDANAPLLWDYANKKQRLEKAVLSYKTEKGRPYTLELRNVLVAHLSILGDTLDVTLHGASSRLIVPARRQ